MLNEVKYLKSQVNKLTQQVAALEDILRCIDRRCRNAVSTAGDVTDLYEYAQAIEHIQSLINGETANNRA